MLFQKQSVGKIGLWLMDFKLQFYQHPLHHPAELCASPSTFFAVLLTSSGGHSLRADIVIEITLTTNPTPKSHTPNSGRNYYFTDFATHFPPAQVSLSNDRISPDIPVYSNINITMRDRPQIDRKPAGVGVLSLWIGFFGYVFHNQFW